MVLLRLGLLTFSSFVVFCFIRIFDNNTFIFIQVFFLSVLLYVFLKITSYKRYQLWMDNALLYSLLVFFSLIFFLMNVDRSRSIHIYERIHFAASARIENVEGIAEYLDLRGEELIAFKQRLYEQENLGGFTIKSNIVKETRFGAAIRVFSRTVAKMANLNGYPSLK